MGKRKSPSTGRASPGLTTRADGRVRPTNNQLLYKAHLRWDRHYAYGANPALNLPRETPGFPSVTSCFLRVLCALQKAEEARCGRSILNILSTNTRRTKVVELSSGTHRVPDELRKHYLSDALGGQYSTNLDRNRYGQDDNYLFTVIRYDLEFLSLCPCLVDVEIVDVKMGNQSILVSAGDEYCKCNKAHSGCADSHEPSAQAASSSQTPRRGRAAAIAPQLTTLPGGAACAHGTAQPSITSMDAGGKLPDLTQAHPFAWDPSLLSLGGPLSLPGFPGSLQPHSHPLMQPTPGNAQHLHRAASGSGGLHAPPGLPHGLSLPPPHLPHFLPPQPLGAGLGQPNPPSLHHPSLLPPNFLDSTLPGMGSQQHTHPQGQGVPNSGSAHGGNAAAAALMPHTSSALPQHPPPPTLDLASILGGSSGSGAGVGGNSGGLNEQLGASGGHLGSLPGLGGNTHPGSTLNGLPSHSSLHAGSLHGVGLGNMGSSGGLDGNVGGPGTASSLSVLNQPLVPPPGAGSAAATQGGGGGPAMLGHAATSQLPSSAGGLHVNLGGAASPALHDTLRSPMHAPRDSSHSHALPPPSPPAFQHHVGSPQPSASGASQLFDALVMAATGHQNPPSEALPLPGLGSEPAPLLAPHKTMSTGGNAPNANGLLPSASAALPDGHARFKGGGADCGEGSLAALGRGTGGPLAPGQWGPGGMGGLAQTGSVGGGLGGGGMLDLRGGSGSSQQEGSDGGITGGEGGGIPFGGLGGFGGPGVQQRSRLWSAMSFGDTSSLQNALDAFRAEEELNNPYSLGPEALAELAHAGGGAHRASSQQQHPPQREHPWLEDGAVGSAGALRPRHRKPLRASSSFLMRCAHNSAADVGLQERLGVKADPNGAGHTATNNGNGLGADQSSVDWASSARGSPAPPAYGANGGLGGLQEGGGAHAGGAGRKGIVGETAVPTTGAGATACANGSGVVGGAAESVAEGDNDHMEGVGGTKGGRGGEEQEVGSGSRDARDATKGGPGSETCFTDTAARVHSLERELHLMRKECASHAAARRAAEDQLIGLSQELWQARRVQAILLSRLSGGARGALEGSSLMPSGVDQATIDGALKGMLAGLGWGPEVGEIDEHHTSQQQQQQQHTPQQQQQQQDGHPCASHSQQQQHHQQNTHARGQMAFRAWQPHKASSGPPPHATHAPGPACPAVGSNGHAPPHSRPDPVHGAAHGGGPQGGSAGAGVDKVQGGRPAGLTQQQQEQQGAHTDAGADAHGTDHTAENDPSSTPFSQQQAQHPGPKQLSEPGQATWPAQAAGTAAQAQTTLQQSQQSPHLQPVQRQGQHPQDGAHTLMHTHAHGGTGTGTGTTGVCSELGAGDDNDNSGGGVGAGVLSGGATAKAEQEVDPSVNTTTGGNRPLNDNGSGSGNTTGNSGTGGATHMQVTHSEQVHPEPEKSPSPMHAHKRMRTLAPQASAQGCT